MCSPVLSVPVVALDVHLPALAFIQSCLIFLLVALFDGSYIWVVYAAIFSIQLTVIALLYVELRSKDDPVCACMMCRTWTISVSQDGVPGTLSSVTVAGDRTPLLDITPEPAPAPASTGTRPSTPELQRVITLPHFPGLPQWTHPAYSPTSPEPDPESPTLPPLVPRQHPRVPPSILAERREKIKALAKKPKKSKKNRSIGLPDKSTKGDYLEHIDYSMVHRKRKRRLNF